MGGGGGGGGGRREGVFCDLGDQCFWFWRKIAEE